MNGLQPCPKDRKVNLERQVLTAGLDGLCCPDCKGTWIPAEDYKTWQAQHPDRDVTADEVMPKILDVEYQQSPLDSRAALCPDCQRYLSRAKVNLKTPFYVERCLDCGGVWCDRGEWQVLEKLGLHTCIEKLFSSAWQERVRVLAYAERERQATRDKLGEELAAQVFELATLLENHPNGDFGVAYLMRRFEQ